jgi:hypothetical protein
MSPATLSRKELRGSSRQSQKYFPRVGTPGQIDARKTAMSGLVLEKSRGDSLKSLPLTNP